MEGAGRRSAMRAQMLQNPAQSERELQPKKSGKRKGKTDKVLMDLAQVLGDLSEQIEDLDIDVNQVSVDDSDADFPAYLPEFEYTLLRLTEDDVAIQKKIFDQFDTDDTGQLAQTETVRMLKAMDLFDTTDDLVANIKAMDEDNSGTIDYMEYLQFIDAKCHEDEEFYKMYRARSHSTKLGYDGTLWRKHANIAWLTNQGILILTSLGVLFTLIYFRFILVPLTMAYFLTFLLGPVQDVLIQRPLICCDAVCCDKPGVVRPALGQTVGLLGKEKGSWWEDADRTKARYQTPQERWQDVVKDTGEWDPVKREMRWVKGDEAACCYAIPPKSWSDEPAQGGGVLKRAVFDLFALGKVPESLSVLFTFILTGSVLFMVLVVISAEIVDVVEDPAFQQAKKEAVINLNKYLRVEYGLEVTELIQANSTVENEVQEYGQDDVAAIATPWLLVINDVVTTLLLCMYMLSTRVPEHEEAVYKEVQRMSLFEKIRDKIKHYVILKTALSALTGGVVGFILFVTKVRLAMLFGLLTFMLNFIPTVGSLVAMFLPIPIIVLDQVEDDYAGRQAMALVLPVLVQGYVGNILEPVLFGKSLNVTAISVLVALVLWGSIWGVQGAVLSVPLLAAMKVALEEADHPMAKMLLRVVRESASIDDAVESQKGRKERSQEKQKEREAIKRNLPLRSPSSKYILTDEPEHFANPMGGIREEEEEDLEAGGTE